LLRDDSRTLMPDAVTDEYARNIEAIARRCDTADIDCVFVTQPTGYRTGASDDYRSGFWMTPPYENYSLTFDSMRHIAALYNDWLRAFGARENMPVCDATIWIEPSYRHLYDEVHFNVAGAKAMADGLARCLADYGWPSALE
jgi:lysophospholipase L1-like esterase